MLNKAIMINMATMTTLFIARCESFAIADARYNEKEKKSKYSKASILKILGRVDLCCGLKDEKAIST